MFSPEFQPHDSDRSTGIQIRPARPNDLSELLAIEQICFTSDRLSKRSFKHFLHSSTALLAVAQSSQSSPILGYVLILYHRGTCLARLYSVAVLPQAQGQGIAQQLMHFSELQAAQRHCIFMRLEVRLDNEAAIRIYQRMGYKSFGIYKQYYDDQEDALRLQKRILYHQQSCQFRTIPYYSQTTDFTCGPAALMMAMQALKPEFSVTQHLELQLWREATTIFMTSGHGGCGPHGLALAAWQRGFDVEMMISHQQPLFIDSVRSTHKKEVLTLVHNDFLSQISKTSIRAHHRPLTINDIEHALNQNQVAIVLISTYQLDRCKTPHWVVVTDIDKYFVYIHDPYIDEKYHKTALDNQHLPIRRESFGRMCQFGKVKLRTALFLNKSS
ncbi:GNAT family N-acetyltransferase/peptidase C39 family protein [Zooshikella harenae]|uniref:GNAT family N-acetyltransferase/peptidase C39 family protein n=1 Tax=Zooshikella harenae TaxID=2827238 RepID=A0ABS5ZBT9_9GAMM|nr:GNAT family N-acetyltransferase/peptidase C39 family protein [Zooshikella harenae]MBU2711343.1 GNAT family N-acetyltransferase/peptidase C39 family protein [Zooshikella harenae]